jgi:integrative and conjugative element protein (TIGR02256 family)
MQLIMSLEIHDQLVKELRSAGSREIGGLLFAEHLGGDIFNLVEVSVQRKGGTAGRFVRDPQQHQEQLNKFFETTGNDHTRFNYLGEWHSHPSFCPLPSPEDIETMNSLVADPSVGANFAVLLIVRRQDNRLSASATPFRKSEEPVASRLYIEADRPLLPRRRFL